ncbi:uncharacterized protein LOC126366589 isoform X1 [Pectinophora gossypiella]|uniref:uncharacterized protein LOC126366589 isoform X1 n=1 Tax=Pectinophora gossypiella TaxID=13191 RepID=UPI00214EDAA1|nr:uncharacterized protein LOC126366589 isoform X1 [Pectinophora gossypiella]
MNQGRNNNERRNNNEGGSGWGTAAVVGGVLGGLAAVAGGVYYLTRGRDRNREEDQQAQAQGQAQSLRRSPPRNTQETRQEFNMSDYLSNLLQGMHTSSSNGVQPESARSRRGVPRSSIPSNPALSNLNDLVSDIYLRYIALNDEDFEDYYNVVHTIFHQIHDKMKEVDPYYKQYSSMVQFAGSHPDRLRINEPDEFDIDIVIGLPLNYNYNSSNPADNDFILEPKDPGFIQLKVSRRWRLSRHQQRLHTKPNQTQQRPRRPRRSVVPNEPHQRSRRRRRPQRPSVPNGSQDLTWHPAIPNEPHQRSRRRRRPQRPAVPNGSQERPWNPALPKEPPQHPRRPALPNELEKCTKDVDRYGFIVVPGQKQRCCRICYKRCTVCHALQKEMGVQYQRLPVRDGCNWHINRTCYEWKDDKNYLLRSNFSNWFKSVVNKALNHFEVNSSSPPIFYVEGVPYTVRKSESGPAMTVFIENKSKDFKLDVDLVPALRFPIERWPICNGYMNVPPECANKDYWMVVPKPNKNGHTTHDTNRSWRIAMHEQERMLMHNTNHLRQAIRLLKKFRDSQGMDKIASYYIKTLFFWEVLDRKNDPGFWNKAPAYIFTIMVKKFHKCLQEKRIPYLWNKNNNLIGCVKPEILIGYAAKTAKFLKVLENPSEYKEVARFLLTSAEFKEYNERFLHI